MTFGKKIQIWAWEKLTKKPILGPVNVLICLQPSSVAYLMPHTSSKHIKSTVFRHLMEVAMAASLKHHRSRD